MSLHGTGVGEFREMDRASAQLSAASILLSADARKQNQRPKDPFNQISQLSTHAIESTIILPHGTGDTSDRQSESFSMFTSTVGGKHRTVEQVDQIDSEKIQSRSKSDKRQHELSTPYLDTKQHERVVRGSVDQHEQMSIRTNNHAVVDGTNGSTTNTRGTRSSGIVPRLFDHQIYPKSSVGDNNAELSKNEQFNINSNHQFPPLYAAAAEYHQQEEMKQRGSLKRTREMKNQSSTSPSSSESDSSQREMTPTSTNIIDTAVAAWSLTSTTQSSGKAKSNQITSSTPSSITISDAAIATALSEMSDGEEESIIAIALDKSKSSSYISTDSSADGSDDDYRPRSSQTKQSAIEENKSENRAVEQSRTRFKTGIVYSSPAMKIGEQMIDHPVITGDIIPPNTAIELIPLYQAAILWAKEFVPTLRPKRIKMSLPNTLLAYQNRQKSYRNLPPRITPPRSTERRARLRALSELTHNVGNTKSLNGRPEGWKEDPITSSNKSTLAEPTMTKRVFKSASFQQAMQVIAEQAKSTLTTPMPPQQAYPMRTTSTTSTSTITAPISTTLTRQETRMISSPRTEPIVIQQSMTSPQKTTMSPKLSSQIAAARSIQLIERRSSTETKKSPTHSASISQCWRSKPTISVQTNEQPLSISAERQRRRPQVGLTPGEVKLIGEVQFAWIDESTKEVNQRPTRETVIRTACEYDVNDTPISFKPIGGALTFMDTTARHLVAKWRILPSIDRNAIANAGVVLHFKPWQPSVTRMNNLHNNSHYSQRNQESDDLELLAGYSTITLSTQFERLGLSKNDRNSNEARRLIMNKMMNKIRRDEELNNGTIAPHLCEKGATKLPAGERLDTAATFTELPPSMINYRSDLINYDYINGTRRTPSTYHAYEMEQSIWSLPTSSRKKAMDELLNDINRKFDDRRHQRVRSRTAFRWKIDAKQSAETIELSTRNQIVDPRMIIPGTVDGTTTWGNLIAIASIAMEECGFRTWDQYEFTAVTLCKAKGVIITLPLLYHEQQSMRQFHVKINGMYLSTQQQVRKCVGIKYRDRKLTSSIHILTDLIRSWDSLQQESISEMRVRAARIAFKHLTELSLEPKEMIELTTDTRATTPPWAASLNKLTTMALDGNGISPLLDDYRQDMLMLDAAWKGSQMSYALEKHFEAALGNVGGELRRTSLSSMFARLNKRIQDEHKYQVIMAVFVPNEVKNCTITRMTSGTQSEITNATLLSRAQWIKLASIEFQMSMLRESTRTGKHAIELMCEWNYFRSPLRRKLNLTATTVNELAERRAIARASCERSLALDAAATSQQFNDATHKERYESMIGDLDDRVPMTQSNRLKAMTVAATLPLFINLPPRADRYGECDMTVEANQQECARRINNRRSTFGRPNGWNEDDQPIIAEVLQAIAIKQHQQQEIAEQHDIEAYLRHHGPQSSDGMTLNDVYTNHGMAQMVDATEHELQESLSKFTTIESLTADRPLSYDDIDRLHEAKVERRTLFMRSDVLKVCARENEPTTTVPLSVLFNLRDEWHIERMQLGRSSLGDMVRTNDQARPWHEQVLYYETTTDLLSPQQRREQVQLRKIDELGFYRDNNGSITPSHHALNNVERRAEMTTILRRVHRYAWKESIYHQHRRLTPITEDEKEYADAFDHINRTTALTEPSSSMREYQTRLGDLLYLIGTTPTPIGTETEGILNEGHRNSNNGNEHTRLIDKKKRELNMLTEMTHNQDVISTEATLTDSEIRMYTEVESKANKKTREDNSHRERELNLIAAIRMVAMTDYPHRKLYAREQAYEAIQPGHRRIKLFEGEVIRCERSSLTTSNDTLPIIRGDIYNFYNRNNTTSITVETRAMSVCNALIDGWKQSYESVNDYVQSNNDEQQECHGQQRTITVRPPLLNYQLRITIPRRPMSIELLIDTSGPQRHTTIIDNCLELKMDRRKRHQYDCRDTATIMNGELLEISTASNVTPTTEWVTVPLPGTQAELPNVILQQKGETTPTIIPFFSKNENESEDDEDEPMLTTIRTATVRAEYDEFTTEDIEWIIDHRRWLDIYLPENVLSSVIKKEILGKHNDIAQNRWEKAATSIARYYNYKINRNERRQAKEELIIMCEMGIAIADNEWTVKESTVQNDAAHDDQKNDTVTETNKSNPSNEVLDGDTEMTQDDKLDVRVKGVCRTLPATMDHQYQDRHRKHHRDLNESITTSISPSSSTTEQQKTMSEQLDTTSKQPDRQLNRRRRERKKSKRNHQRRIVNDETWQSRLVRRKEPDECEQQQRIRTNSPFIAVSPTVKSDDEQQSKPTLDLMCFGERLLPRTIKKIIEVREFINESSTTPQIAKEQWEQIVDGRTEKEWVIDLNRSFIETTGSDGEELKVITNDYECGEWKEDIASSSSSSHRMTQQTQSSAQYSIVRGENQRRESRDDHYSCATTTVTSMSEIVECSSPISWCGSYDVDADSVTSSSIRDSESATSDATPQIRIRTRISSPTDMSRKTRMMQRKRHKRSTSSEEEDRREERRYGDYNDRQTSDNGVPIDKWTRGTRVTSREWLGKFHEWCTLMKPSPEDYPRLLRWHIRDEEIEEVLRAMKQEETESIADFNTRVGTTFIRISTPTEGHLRMLRQRLLFTTIGPGENIRDYLQRFREAFRMANPGADYSGEVMDTLINSLDKGVRRVSLRWRWKADLIEGNEQRHNITVITSWSMLEEVIITHYEERSVSEQRESLNDRLRSCFEMQQYANAGARGMFKGEHYLGTNSLATRERNESRNEFAAFITPGLSQGRNEEENRVVRFTSRQHQSDREISIQQMTEQESHRPYDKEEVSEPRAKSRTSMVAISNKQTEQQPTPIMTTLLPILVSTPAQIQQLMPYQQITNQYQQPLVQYQQSAIEQPLIQHQQSMIQQSPIQYQQSPIEYRHIPMHQPLVQQQRSPIPYQQPPIPYRQPQNEQQWNQYQHPLTQYPLIQQQRSLNPPPPWSEYHYEPPYPPSRSNQRQTGYGETGRNDMKERKVTNKKEERSEVRPTQQRIAPSFTPTSKIASMTISKSNNQTITLPTLSPLQPSMGDNICRECCLRHITSMCPRLIIAANGQTHRWKDTGAHPSADRADIAMIMQVYGSIGVSTATDTRENRGRTTTRFTSRMMHVGLHGQQEVIISGTINGKLACEILIDTGSHMTLGGHEWWKKNETVLGPLSPPPGFDLTTTTDQKVSAAGQITVEITLKDIETKRSYTRTAEILIVRGYKKEILAGMDLLTRFFSSLNFLDGRMSYRPEMKHDRLQEGITDTPTSRIVVSTAATLGPRSLNIVTVETDPQMKESEENGKVTCTPIPIYNRRQQAMILEFKVLASDEQTNNLDNKRQGRFSLGIVNHSTKTVQLRAGMPIGKATQSVPGKQATVRPVIMMRSMHLTPRGEEEVELPTKTAEMDETNVMDVSTFVESIIEPGPWKRMQNGALITCTPVPIAITEQAEIDRYEHRIRNNNPQNKIPRADILLRMADDHTFRLKEHREEIVRGQYPFIYISRILVQRAPGENLWLPIIEEQGMTDVEFNALVLRTNGSATKTRGPWHREQGKFTITSTIVPSACSQMETAEWIKRVKNNNEENIQPHREEIRPLIKRFTLYAAITRTTPEITNTNMDELVDQESSEDDEIEKENIIRQMNINIDYAIYSSTEPRVTEQYETRRVQRRQGIDAAMVPSIPQIESPPPPAEKYSKLYSHLAPKGEIVANKIKPRAKPKGKRQIAAEVAAAAIVPIAKEATKTNATTIEATLRSPTATPLSSTMTPPSSIATPVSTAVSTTTALVAPSENIEPTSILATDTLTSTSIPTSTASSPTATPMNDIQELPAVTTTEVETTDERTVIVESTSVITTNISPTVQQQRPVTPPIPTTNSTLSTPTQPSTTSTVTVTEEIITSTVREGASTANENPAFKIGSFPATEDTVELIFDINPKLAPEEIKRIDNMLRPLINAFAIHPKDAPAIAKGIEHEIHLTDTHPIKKMPYRLPHEKQEVVRATIKELLDRGLIIESNSPWSSPIVLVKKSNGRWRMCVDYRLLNNVTKKDAYPIPIIDDCLASCNKADWFSVLDIKDAFHHVAMEKYSQPMTAFVTQNGLYEWRRMPMGLTNGPATFQRYVDASLRDVSNICSPFFDDVLIFTEGSLETHIEHIRTILVRLERAGLEANIEKCKFAYKEVLFVGHIIRKGEIVPDPQKLDAVKNWPAPINEHQVRVFLGFMNYYHKYIKGFASISAPLNDLLKKGVKWEWPHKAQVAFEKLKGAMLKAPCLRAPDHNRPFKVETDASGVGIGAVISQEYEDGDHPCGYISRQLNKAERNYSTIEWEMLAIVFALSQFEQLLIDKHFTIITDHSPLIWMQTAKMTNSRVARWAMRLQGFNFTIIARAGTLNGNADALSRWPRDDSAPAMGPEDDMPATAKGDIHAHFIRSNLIHLSPFDPITGERMPAQQQQPINRPQQEKSTVTVESNVNMTNQILDGEQRMIRLGKMSERKQHHHKSSHEQRHQRRCLEEEKEETFTSLEPNTVEGKIADTEGERYQRENVMFTIVNLKQLDHLVKAQYNDPPTMTMIEYVRSRFTPAIFTEQQKTKLQLQGENYALIPQQGDIKPALFYQPARPKGGIIALLPLQPRLVIPPAYRSTLIKLFHDAPFGGHMGIKRTARRIQSNYYWDSLLSDVITHINECVPCQKEKTERRRIRAPQGMMADATYPFELMSMDFVGPLTGTKDENFTNILVMIDHFTRWVIAIPTRDQRAETVVACLTDEVFNKFGIPARLLSDRGQSFMGNIVAQLCESYGIKQLFTSAHHPQANGMVERANGTIKAVLSTLCEENKEKWAMMLPAAIHAINNTNSEATGYSPQWLNFGRLANSPGDALAMSALSDDVGSGKQELEPFIQMTLENQQIAHNFVRLQNANKRAKIDQVKEKMSRIYSYAPGDLVWLRDAKQDSDVRMGRTGHGTPFIGPFIVIRRLSEQAHTYEIAPSEGNGKSYRQIVHINRLKPFKTNKKGKKRAHCQIKIAADENADDDDEEKRPRERKRRTVPEEKKKRNNQARPETKITSTSSRAKLNQAIREQNVVIDESKEDSPAEENELSDKDEPMTDRDTSGSKRITQDLTDTQQQDSQEQSSSSPPPLDEEIDHAMRTSSDDDSDSEQLRRQKEQAESRRRRLLRHPIRIPVPGTRHIPPRNTSFAPAIYNEQLAQGISEWGGSHHRTNVTGR